MSLVLTLRKRSSYTRAGSPGRKNNDYGTTARPACRPCLRAGKKGQGIGKEGRGPGKIHAPAPSENRKEKFMIDSDIVVIKANSPEAIANRERPTIVLPGGGKRIRFHDGREVVIGGESLRHALRGRRIRKALIPGDPIYNGKELVVD